MTESTATMRPPSRPGRALPGWRAMLAGAVALAIALLPFAIDQTFYYTIGVLVCLNAVLALSVHLMLRIGQLSLAQAGFMGVGAYASALLSRDLGWSSAASVVSAIAIAALLALLVSRVILRIRGVQFVLLTFALGQAITLVFTEWIVPFGGNSGLVGVPPLRWGALTLKARDAFYGYSLIVLALSTLACRALFRGDCGRVLAGLAGNEALLQSLGVHALAYRTMVFTVSAALAALSGASYAHFVGHLSPDAFHVSVAINALMMNVIGGAGALWGPLAGALFLVPLPEFFRGTIVYLQLFYGLALVAVMVFAPRGLAGLLGRGR